MGREWKLTSKSADEKLFEDSQLVPLESQSIENTGTATTIPLSNLSSRILSKVREYLKYHVEAKKPADENSALTDDEIKTWDQDFVNLDRETLFDLLQVLCVKPSNWKFHR